MRAVGAGRQPAEDRSTVVTRNKPKTSWVEIPDRPFEEGKARDLPAMTGFGWPAATVRWWNTIRTMPHCVLWTESDWMYAVDTAYVHRLFIMTSGEKGGAEVRARGRHMGITEEARRTLLIKYVDPATLKPDLSAVADVTAIDNVKAMVKPPRKRVLAVDPDSVK